MAATQFPLPAWLQNLIGASPSPLCPTPATLLMACFLPRPGKPVLAASLLYKRAGSRPGQGSLLGKQVERDQTSVAGPFTNTILPDSSSESETKARGPASLSDHTAWGQGHWLCLAHSKVSNFLLVTHNHLCLPHGPEFPLNLESDSGLCAAESACPTAGLAPSSPCSCLTPAPATYSVVGQTSATCSKLPGHSRAETRLSTRRCLL